ncbi:MAG TPA: FAD-dependent oxidoreductase, partial [Nocardioides sp.]|nr:FAD-dependent oxidoreductase [Nocardioides sp.]
MTDGEFDVLVLGAGSGGYACALRAAQLGLKVGLVEKGNLGGTCLHVGCIPTKALLHAAEVADSAREAGQFGVTATLDGIDMPGVNAYKDKVVDRLFKGLTGLIKSRGITVIEGTGTLTGPRTVTVDGTEHTGRAVVLASGSYSRTLPGLEVDGTRVLTSEHALRLDHVPASAIVLGGGVIGCEFASVWKSFGADVTIIEALPRLIAGEDEASSKALERAFRKRKI